MSDTPAPPPSETPSQTAAMTCPTCRQRKQWKGDKPGSMGTKTQAKGMKFRSLRVKRGPGRLRKKAKDPRFREFF